MISISRQDLGAVTILRITGEIDENGMNDLRLNLMTLIQDHRCNVVANLDAVTYVSYMGVGVLVERLRQLRAYGGDMKLVGVNTYTTRLFRMIGVTNLFETFDTESQAIQQYQRAA